ncbi:OmpW family outer membrane protein [Robertkochia aurantiaca]|uniref:OmpW family outer membrane protein n=1 Tax=Robertkochia aurantiaca TaxID=2873700 RepID=UPI001CCA69C7|nr:OmpW family outer membrane protein [Robertkochia sp. 3YJGBD-33]
MKSIIKIIVIPVFLILMTLSHLRAQEGYYGFNYSVGIPADGMSDYLSETGWGGASFEFRREIASHLALGFDIGFNNFYEELPYDTYTEGTVSITGLQNRKIFSLPITLTADYYFDFSDKFKAFAGLGVGTMYTDRETEFGLFVASDDVWFFVIKPELGLIFMVNDHNGIKFTGRYLKTFDTDVLDALSYATLDLGWVFFF